LLVGSPNDLSSSRKGKAYLFDKNENWAQNTVNTAEFTASNGAAGDRFGHALGLKSEDIVVGAPFFDGPATNTGMAYQFSKPLMAWANATESMTLNPPALNGNYQRKYAEVVCLREEAVFFGVPNEGLYDGAVFVHRKEAIGWSASPNANLNNDNGTFFDYLGISLVALENEVLAGLPGDDLDNLNEGTLNVFNKQNATWDPSYGREKIMGPSENGFSEEFFGSSIDMEGDIAVVGAPNQNRSGVVYVKQFDGLIWNTQAVLKPSTSMNFLDFGKFVQISGDWIAVTTTYNTTLGANIYLYKKTLNGWVDATETVKIPMNGVFTSLNSLVMNNQTLVTSNPQQKKAYVFEKGNGDWTSTHLPIAELTTLTTSFTGFGNSIAIENDVIVISDPYLKIGSRDEAGAVYVYEKPSLGWANAMETAKLEFSDTQKSNRFGFSVDIEDDLIIVGCPYFSSNFSNTYPGAGFVFQRSGLNWTSMNELAKLELQSATVTIRLGFSVAIENGIIFLGAPYFRSFNSNASNGAIAIYDKGIQPTWTNSFETDLFYARPVSSSNPIGFNIVIEGNKILAGAAYHDSLGNNTGLVYNLESCYSVSESSIAACGSYTWINGITYTVTPAEQLVHRLTNAQGCDSIVRLNLSIHNIGANTTYSFDTLSAFPQGKLYSWVDCDDNYSVITPFSSDNKLNVTISGNYAVIVKDGNCVDTSDCKQIIISQAGLDHLSAGNFVLFPNPVHSNETLYLKANKNIQSYRISSLNGQVLLEQQTSPHSEIVIQTKQLSGVYLVEVRFEDGSKRVERIVYQ
jgi:hypothetical protein